MNEEELKKMEYLLITLMILAVIAIEVTFVCLVAKIFIGLGVLVGLGLFFVDCCYLYVVTEMAKMDLKNKKEGE